MQSAGGDCTESYQCPGAHWEMKMCRKNQKDSFPSCSPVHLCPDAVSLRLVHQHVDHYSIMKCVAQLQWDITGASCGDGLRVRGLSWPARRCSVAVGDEKFSGSRPVLCGAWCHCLDRIQLFIDFAIAELAELWIRVPTILRFEHGWTGPESLIVFNCGQPPQTKTG